MRWLLLTLGASLALGACASSSPNSQPTQTTSGKQTYAYSLVAPLSASQSGLVARAVLPQGSSCPALELTGAASVPMQQRQPAASTDGVFDDVVVCSAPIPPGATKASVNGVDIPSAMPEEVKTVAALADTGCMVFKGVTQDCNSAAAWPFGQLAKQIADADPSLIIHVGDYFYREFPCPASQSAKCGGSPAPPKGMPFLDSGEGWLADFFEPAKVMFGTAPLMAIRGNHEICSVAGNGFFLFMDPRPGTAQTCAPTQKGSKSVVPAVLTKPWKADVSLISGGSLRLIAVDSSHGWTDGQSSWWPKLRPGYKTAHKWAQDKGVQSWLVTHQPSLGLTSIKMKPKGLPDWQPWVSGDQVAASYDLLKPYKTILSGHLHLSELVQVPGLPPQFIVGGGGTYLDRPNGYETPKYGALANSLGKPVMPGVKPYPPAAYRWTQVQHAFGLATPNPAQGAWDITYTQPNGSTLAKCEVQGVGTANCS